GRPQPPRALRARRPRRAKGHHAARRDPRGPPRRVRPRLCLQDPGPRGAARAPIQSLRPRTRPGRCGVL
ncbi:MAG: hypothetical protein AVDCRST_MAG03-2046, partial [uncultured Rubrobacteraceae bacterium]